MRQEDARPNVLLIVADQHRSDYLGHAVDAVVDTPNLDRLAARGTRFTHCFSNSPICGPARAALAAGQRPHRLGILNNSGHLPLSRPTIYQRLRDHGYWTGLIGKLDIEKGAYPGRDRGPDSRNPVMMAYGFCDHIHASAGMAVPEQPQMPFHHYLASHGLYNAFRDDRERRKQGRWCVGVNFDSPLSAKHHIETYVGDHGVRWIEDPPPNHPWFLQLNFDGPHDPFDPPPEYAEKYRGRTMPAPVGLDQAGKPDWVRHKFFTDDREDIQQARRQYAASVELIDHQIGRLMDALECSGQLDNTVVIYTADHGEMLGDFGLYQKQVPYDPSIRVPLIVAGPGIARGATSDALLEWIDLNPTIADLAGLPKQPYVDAESVAPILRTPRGGHRSSVLITLESYRALRTRDYKLVHNINDIRELYDLTRDPDECDNLLADPATPEAEETAARLAAEMKRELQRDTWLR